MDMTLYSLVLSKLENQDSCLLWNGFRIEIVDELPNVQVPNTIYFIKSNIAKKEETYIQTSSGEGLVTQDGKKLILK